MAVQDHIERCAIEELLRLKPHLNISKLGDELLKRTPRIDWFRWEVEHDRVVSCDVSCSKGEQDGLVKPKDYQGEHIVGAGEPTHMISKNLLAG